MFKFFRRAFHSGKPQPLFSLIYTTVRPERVLDDVALWNSRAELGKHEWIFVADLKDMRTADQMAKATAKYAYPTENFHAQPDAPFNCVKAWNLGAAKSNGKVLIAVSDDWVPPQGWDRQLAELHGGFWMDEDRAVLVDDSHSSEVCTLPICTRKRYDICGYLLHPGFESMFSDTDFTDAATADGALIQALHIHFTHRHWQYDQRDYDRADHNHSNPLRYWRGHKLFWMRQQLSFPKEDTLPPWMLTELERERAIDRLNFCAVYVVNRDDFCLYESAAFLAVRGVKNFLFVVPNKTWDGDAVSVAETKTIHDVASKLPGWGALAKVVDWNIDQQLEAGRYRAEIEAHVRNSAARFARDKFDTKHILMVDADELWRPGVLEHVALAIEVDNPSAVSLGMIPVVGLPGYPIQNSLDMALVYVRADNEVVPSRSSICAPHQHWKLGMPGIYHFTGTRRTVEELYKKNRIHSHGDDPAYDFTRWMREVFPEIKPGARNVHMKHTAKDQRNLWPLVRDWLPGEREALGLPERLTKLLGIYD